MSDHSPRLWSRSRLWVLLLAGVVGLLPFVNKPFHIDDPLFLWAARHIQSHPADFYGFSVNWYGAAMPMADVTQNPPLACYYTALAAAVLGWSEPALHLAFLFPTLLVLWGTYRLAELFGGRPLLAGLVTLCTPVFLVSSTSVMCDTMMLAFWVWTLVWWERGLRQQRPALLYAAGVLIGACALTKYFGMCLIPLLAAYSLAGRQPWRRWLGPLLLAILILAGYHQLTRELYGRSLLMNAADYVTEVRARMPPGRALLTALSFLGGCTVSVVFFLPWLFTWRACLGLAAAGGGLLLLAVAQLETPMGHRGLIVGQVVVFGTLGVAVLALAAADLWARREAASLLLFLWVLGTFLFAGYVNWTVNGRSILPLVPAVGILITRRLARVHGTARPRWLPLALLPAAGLTLLVTWADYTLASATRQTAERVVAETGEVRGTRWFQGHWGFQYYLQQGGWQAWDQRRSQVQPGDLMAVPANNTNVSENLLSPAMALPRTAVEAPSCRWLATMNQSVAAGYYASLFGPLPFAVGAVPPERCRVYEVTAPLRAGAKP